MPKYVFVTTAGYGMEAGKEFETDSLHPVLRQHVRLVSQGRDLPEEQEPEKQEEEPEKTEPTKSTRAKPAKPEKDPDDDNT